MKYDCELIRDLMPLCMDGTASETSRRMVGEHVLECKPCMDVYQEMRTEVNVAPPDADPNREPFSHTVRKLRHRRQKRWLIAGIIGAVTALLIFLAAGHVYQTLTTDYACLSAEGDYDFEIQCRSNGQVVVILHKLNGMEQDARWSFDRNTGVMTLYAVTPTWAKTADEPRTVYFYDDLYWDHVSKCLLVCSTNAVGERETVEVKEVRRGKNTRSQGESTLTKILYVQGDELPRVDAELDASYPVYIVQDSEFTAGKITFASHDELNNVVYVVVDEDGEYEVYGELIVQEDDGSYTIYGSTASPTPTILPVEGVASDTDTSAYEAAQLTPASTLTPAPTLTPATTSTPTPAP